MSTVSLDAALSGLRAAQQALNTASTNIANVSTPGYTRKIVQQEAQVVGGTAVGVTASTITRVVNTALLRAAVQQSSVSSNYQTTAQYLSRVQDFYGSSSDGRTVADKLAALSNSFVTLSTAPDSTPQLSQTLTSAQQLATGINTLSKQLNGLRQQTETDISAGVGAANSAIESIASLNVRINELQANGQNTGDLEDQRDSAISTLSQYMDVTTFTDGSGMTVVMTARGDVLADASAHKLSFNQSTMLPTSYYPGGTLSGLNVGGHDIAQSGVGGSLGALFDLRDKTLPTYSAQLDEFAQKLADRFQGAGLKLFVGNNGEVPANAEPPDPVTYTGFAAQIRVNPAVVNDPTLLRNGTTGNTEDTGSNEVIRRVSQFVFGTTAAQQAEGDIDISDTSQTLYGILGLTTNNRVTGTVNLAAVSPNVGALAGTAWPGDFDLTLYDSTGASTTQTITVEDTDTVTSIKDKINAAFGSTVASVNSLGALALNNQGDIEIADNTIGNDNMAALGLSFGTYTMPQPAFQIQAGSRSPVTVSIAPADTAQDLIDKINNNVPGVTASLGDAGQLVITPDDGGDLSLLNVNGTPLDALGVEVTSVAPDPFRQNGLGPGGTLSTGLLANSSLQDYVNSMIALQSEEANSVQDRADKEATYLETLQTRNSNASGVNIDEEMSDLIRIQSAYTAAARMLTATQSIFEELMNAMR